MKFQPDQISAQYRPIPFWSWNDQLEWGELRRQIHEMHDKGMGGFFMHARSGLKTPYLSREWMNAVCACVREAVGLGMKPYLYDENGWPSGFGNGAVNGLGEKYQQKYLRFAPVRDIPAGAENRIIALYDGEYCLCRDADCAGFAAYFDVNPYYVDNLDPEVTQAFIDHIYRFYWKNLPEDVRSGLAGIFTDEPQLSRNGIPWSFVLSAAFEAEYGVPLAPLLPHLFLDRGEFRHTRIHFYRLCARLFRDNYINKIGSWCQRHHWECTGHHLAEENFDPQICSNGAIMPQYSGFSIPGVDHLSRCAASVVADIQVTSVAAQFGKQQILTETFGTSGWNFNMRGMKWLYQQQMTHGINLLCQHLAGYSLHGMRKRDFPASLFYQHSMWRHIRELNDSFARIGQMLALGENECDTLVLHSISTAWMYACCGKKSKSAGRYFAVFDALSQELDRASIPFHYGDEILTEEAGSIEGGRFHIGQRSYTHVVIPPVENLSNAVLSQLRRFVAAGGKVLRMRNEFSDRFFVDGKAAENEEHAFFFSLPEYDDAKAVVAALTPEIRHIDCRVFSGKPGQIRGTWRAFPERREHWYLLTDFDDLDSKIVEYAPGENYQVCDPIEEKSVPTEITLPYPAHELWVIDPASGTHLKKLDHVNLPGSGARFLWEFPAEGWLLLCAVDQEENTLSLDLTTGWRGEKFENVLVLDQAEYRVGRTGEFSGPCNTLSIFNRLLMMEDCDLEMRFAFRIGNSLDLKRANLTLAVEVDPGAVYLLNGIELKKEFSSDYFIDRSIRKLTLPPESLRRGENHIEIHTRFAQRTEIREAVKKARFFEGEANKLFFDSEVEAIYLLGEFGCFSSSVARLAKTKCYHFDPPFTLEAPEKSLDCGKLLHQGFIFFSGFVTLTHTFTLGRDKVARRHTLKLSPFRANSVEVTINGKTKPVIYTAPYEIDVSADLREGENKIGLTFGVAPRNTLGPLHTLDVEPLGVAPDTFLLETGAWGMRPEPNTPAYGVIEFGPDKITLCS